VQGMGNVKKKESHELILFLSSGGDDLDIHTLLGPQM
jgi:hypothetical protein